MEQIFIICTQDGFTCEACWRPIVDCSCEDDIQDYKFYKNIVKES